jgi:predicted transposase YbfD/YdcC
MMTWLLAGEERIMSIESLVRHLSAVGDPRSPGKIEHRLIDILVIAVCAVIACAESWDDIALYGRSKLAWLRTFLDLPNGIPSHDTFRRVFMLIDPDAFERGFAAWVGSLVDGFEREVIAIDGKTLRRSFDRRRERSPLHLVSAWASEQGLVLGQRCVDETSNEITAVPELLDQLALENSIVTLDAMGCQTAIAERILARGADYLLVLKANHPLAYEAVAKHFDQTCFRRGAPDRAACDAFDDTHGRLVRRRVFASTKAASLEALSGWPGLHTVLAVETLRSTKGTPKVETEIRYFLSSCRDDPVVLGRAIRKHWGIENAVHWVLDVTFREDDSRVRDQHAARNLAALRKIAINLVGRDGSTKASVRARRKRAAWDNDYMLQLLAGSLVRQPVKGRRSRACPCR